MFKPALIFAATTLAMSVVSAHAEQANDMADVAQGMAQSVQDAKSTVGRDVQGQAKWAGVWMDEKQVCDQGKLNPTGQRIVQAGQRYSRDHGTRLTLFTPPESGQGVRHGMADDVAKIAPEAVVRPNAMIGRHCYLVISK